MAAEDIELGGILGSLSSSIESGNEQRELILRHLHNIDRQYHELKEEFSVHREDVRHLKNNFDRLVDETYGLSNTVNRFKTIESNAWVAFMLLLFVAGALWEGVKVIGQFVFAKV